ncbi:MAG: hypothetical protein ACI93N_002153, partial [Flavobacteriaceae bacterium]
MKKITLLTFMFAFLTVPLLYGQTNSFTSGNETGQTRLQSIELSNPMFNVQSNNSEYQSSIVSTISHNSTDAFANGLNCAAGEDIGALRAFDLAGDFGIIEDFEVYSVEFGTFYFSGVGPNTVTVNVYSTPTGTFPGGTLTLQGTNTINVTPADNFVLQSVPVTAIIPAGETMIYECYILGDGVSNPGILGNTNPQTGLTYVIAPFCAVPDPVDLGGAYSAVMKVIGEELIPVSSSAFCSTETPLPIDPPALVSTLAAVASTANPGDTGMIGAGLGEYTISSVDLNIQSGWANDLTL